jgi:hypothetical protein
MIIVRNAIKKFPCMCIKEYESSSRTSKSQKGDNVGTISRGVVEGNGTDKVVSGSWVAIAFEDEAKEGHFRAWIGMIQPEDYLPTQGKEDFSVDKYSIIR